MGETPLAEPLEVAGPLIVVGGGRMGEALATGLITAGWPAAQLAIVEKDPARRAELASEGKLASAETVSLALGQLMAGGPIGVVIAVKPNDVEEVCRELRTVAPARILSIAAGVTLARLERWIGSDTAVVRAMPNTPALVGAGASALARGSTASADDVAWAASILKSVGTAMEVPEPSLDAVTGLSGSGPAYVFLLAEALIDAGVLVGLPRAAAKELAVQTLLGSARLLAETGEEPSTLRAGVTSPGGTTAAGVRALEAAGMRSAILEAVTAATGRSRELGQPD
ncbi:MAG: pyrroline-5-carboxylate reductase [Acidimicrobiales bacterium]|nr:pyrroline-5-carboxylate reductase [Acidimicrobiales bacterium]